MAVGLSFPFFSGLLNQSISLISSGKRKRSSAYPLYLLGTLMTKFNAFMSLFKCLSSSLNPTFHLFIPRFWYLISTFHMHFWMNEWVKEGRKRLYLKSLLFSFLPTLFLLLVSALIRLPDWSLAFSTPPGTGSLKFNICKMELIIFHQK